MARPASGRHCAVRYESGPLSETVCGATTPRKRAHERATSNASNEIADVDMDMNEEPCVLRTWNQALSELSTPPITRMRLSPTRPVASDTNLHGA